jgi:predicted esterase
MSKRKNTVVSTMLGAIGALLLSAVPVGASAAGAPALLSYGAVKPTVAGISSGGFMAVQMSIAYSQTFTGAAVFAGGPYYCAVANVDVATTTCMQNNPAINHTGLNVLETDTTLWASSGWIDPTSNLAQQKIYLYSGTNDTVVVQPVVNWLQTYYQHYTSAGNIAYNNKSAAEHSWVTWKAATGGTWSGSGPNTVVNACTFKGSPFINNCGNDPEHDMIKQMYGSVVGRAATASGTMVPFDQTAFVPFGAASAYSVDNTGYVYVPTYCAANAGCKVVVALHGCLQGYGVIGNGFINNSGLNEYADTNKLLIVYPQLIVSSAVPFNPQGCWDFWGYTGPQYPLQSGVQPAMIKAMVDTVMGAHY